MVDLIEKPVTRTTLRNAGWAPGNYMSNCSECGAAHIADKRAPRCFDCAVKLADQLPTEWRVKPLEWERHNDDYWYSGDDFVSYSVQRNGFHCREEDPYRQWEITDFPEFTLLDEQEFPTLEEAQQACEVDRLRLYEERLEPAQSEAAPPPAKWGEEPVVQVHIGGKVRDIDASIAPLVRALNSTGHVTKASCSGHGQRPGNIALADGRELIIARNYEEARQIDALLPDIHGAPPRSTSAQSEASIRADERERLARLALTSASDICTERYLPNDRAKALRWLAEWLRNQAEGE